MKKISNFLKKHFPQSIKSWIILCVTILCASALCAFLQNFTRTEEYSSDVHVPLIFVLATLIIAIFTDGYFYGLISAIISVFAVNWAFTYPYMKLDFSIYGYPLTFITMLGVGFAASTMAAGQRERDKLRIESEREKTRANLLRSVSHDLRTPLTAISGSLSAVLEDDGQLSEETKRELLENARQDADWLNRIVENLLSVTRMSGNGAGKILLTDELPEEVISEAVLKFKKRNPDIRVSVILPEEAVFVPMDAMLIEQVLINILDNAVIHGKTTDEIKIKLQNEKDLIRVTIKDNGQGIEERLIRHLFDGSLQNDENLPDSNRFMGIGLTVCKTIIEAHGGNITAGNSASGGAEFIFTLRKGEEDEYQG